MNKRKKESIDYNITSLYIDRKEKMAYHIMFYTILIVVIIGMLYYSFEKNESNLSNDIDECFKKRCGGQLHNIDCDSEMWKDFCNDLIKGE